MNDLVAFLRARLDEDEQAARDAPRELDSGEWPFWRDVDDESDADATDAYRDRFPPARVLREVKAKRQIVELHPHAYWPSKKGKPHLYCQTCDVEDGVIGGDDGFCLTLRLLALPYADHPDYDESWRP